MIIVAELQPYDPVAAARKTLRATSANDARVTGLNSQRWLPAISADGVTVGISLFKGDFDGRSTATAGSMKLRINRFEITEPYVRRFNWAAAPVRLWAGVAGQAWPWTQFAELTVSDFSAEGNGLSLTMKVNEEPFAANVLTATYTGAGGIEGPVDLKGKPKPFLLGRCSNVEPVLIDAVNNVYQVHGYGTIEAITKIYERGSEFPAAAGDHANYTALVAATIANGAWATCLASGLIRLGAPAYGVITADVDGDKAGGTWRRKPGEIMLRLLDNAGVTSGLIETSAFTGLDTALTTLLTNDGRMGIYLTDQESALDVVSRIAAPCNAQAGVSLLGKIFAVRVAVGSPTMTMDAQQRQMPRVTSSTEQSTSPPYSFMEMGYDRAWRVHTEDEIALNSDSGVPRVEAPASRTFTADYTGTLDAAQLPATFAFKRYKGTVDVSTSTTWTIDSQPGITGGTVTISNGVATIPSGAAIGMSASIRVKSARDAIDIYESVAVSRLDGPAPSGGGGGGGSTTVSDSTLSSVSTTTKSNISDEMTVRTGASGVITFSGALAINATAGGNTGYYGAAARWRFKAVGGSYADVGAADISETDGVVVSFDSGTGEYSVAPGSINVADSKTGLTAGTDYVVVLQAARDSSTPSKTIGFGGTVYAVGS
ncbi:hypothetical protein [Novosphingobium sp.]|uniref:hypothetical protein n=1 Tax=Novosphingobium sp. TaxID=1874826 RepID=UPI00286E01BC|nr:hypothetical protein [Novosphingobium sp.]